MNTEPLDDIVADVVFLCGLDIEFLIKKILKGGIYIKKKYLLYIILLLLIVITVLYFYPMSMRKIMQSNEELFVPQSIKADVYFPHLLSTKEFYVNDDNLVSELYQLVGDIKVRRIIIKPDSYIPKLMNTYWLSIQSKEEKILRIFITNENYIQINDKTYKIVGKVDLRRIYELVLLDQDKDSLDEYYFNILKDN